MAEKDLRKNQAIETETSFIEEHHDRQGFQAIEVSEVDRQISGEGSANLPSTELTCGHQRLNPTTGIIMRIGRHISHVKSAVGGTVTMFMQSGSGTTQDVDDTFTGVCERATKLLTKLHTKYGELVVPNEVIRALTNTNEALEQKDICISVFGQHNCGKSTLLNALIGEELLPIYEMSETSVKIKIQHDGSIHQGACAHNCPYLHSHSLQQSKSCPKLQVFTKSNNEHEIRGAEKIYDYLSDLNKQVRRESSSEPPTVILKANIPLLAGKVPAGWTVSLMDNPGFGEAKEHVVQLADASLVTSSAYIYLLQTENIGGTEAAEFFKELIQKDKSAMRDGRLAVAITKFDANYSSSKSKRRGQRSTHVTVENVRENMITSINDATEGTVVSEDTIVPLCGKWALLASQLANCLISDPAKEIEYRQEEAVKALESYPHLSLPGGQAQSYTNIIKNLSHSDLVMHLENASGINDLKVRIHYVVGKACVKVWATKIFAEFQNYLKTAEDSVDSRSIHLVDLYAEKAEDHGKSKDLYDEIMATKDSIKATAPKRKRKTTTIWKQFEESYLMDLNNHKPQDKGKAEVRDLVKKFKEECQKQISNRCFGPEDFEKNIQVFLDESAPKLQRVFDSSCGFWNVQKVLMSHVEDMVESVTNIRADARVLCRMDSVNVTKSYKRGLQLENKALKKEPNLGDIKLRVKIPSVSLRSTWWEKIIKFFRTLHSKRNNSESGIEYSTFELGANDDHSSPSDSLGELQPTFIEGIHDPNNESDGESEEDDDNSENLVDLTNVNLEENIISDAVSKFEPSVPNKSVLSLYQGEDETDAGSDHQSRSTTTVYRKWTRELDEAIEALRINMEMECDNYFRVIKPNAIKFFYKDYSCKTTDRLDAFEKDFSGHLEQEHKRIKKLSGDMESLLKEYNVLQKKKIDIRNLQDEMWKVYSLEFYRLK